MIEAWKVLRDLGLPDGAIRPLPAVKPQLEGALAAVRQVLESAELCTRDVEILAAWLAAWRHHWPRRFDEIFGAEGHRFVAALAVRRADDNRYLKLRRIAVENLARIL